MFGPLTHTIKWLQAESVMYDHYRIKSKVLFYVKIHVKLTLVFTILRKYSGNVRSAKFHI